MLCFGLIVNSVLLNLLCVWIKREGRGGGGGGRIKDAKQTAAIITVTIKSLSD